jgi:type II secretory pathway component PulF
MAFTPIYFAGEKKLPRGILSNPRVPWPYAVACSLYYLLAYLALVSAVPSFAKVFEGLGVALPLLTRFLIATYRWLLPLFFVGATALTIVKQCVPLEGLRLRVSNLILIFVGAIFAPLVVLAMYLPLIELIWKLKRMH